MELYKLLNKHMSGAKNLRELKFLKINFSLDFTTSYAQPPPQKSVKIFKIDYSGYNDIYQDFDPSGWCKKIAAIFPNLEQLKVKHPYEDTSGEGSLQQEVERNMGLFKNLKLCKFITSESAIL